MSSPDDLPTLKSANKRKKMPDESLLTIKFRWDVTKQYSFHDDSDLRSWYLSPMGGNVKDSLVIDYKDGCRIHFPLMNIESYHVTPPPTRPEYKRVIPDRITMPEEIEDAEAPPAVHD